MNTFVANKQFPAFPRTPTRDLFPMYGYVPVGKGWQIECDVRQRAANSNETHSEMVNPIPGIIKSRKAVEKACYDLNLRVWQAMQGEA